MPADPQQQPTSDINRPWREYVGMDMSTSISAFSYGSGNQSILQIDCMWSDRIDITAEILGHSRKSIFDPTKIQRVIPMRHPSEPWKHAVRITNMRGLAHDEVVGVPKKAEAEAGPQATYRYARLTVIFEPLPYRVLTDADLTEYGTGNEGNRYVIWGFEQSAEFLARKHGSFEWKESGAGGPTIGDAFPGQVSQLLTKMTLTLTWVQVPDIGLFDLNAVSANIEDRVGTVNDASFLGRDAGTLLLMTPRFIPVTLPHKPFLAGLDEKEPARCWNVVLPFKHFKPPIGTGAVTEGWNTLPYRGNNKWYKVTARDGTTSIYQATDFTKIFEMN